MQFKRKRGLYDAHRIEYIPVGDIMPNPDQPRRHLAPDQMRELSESIGKYGVLQPLAVRRYGKGFELLSGERRLRAAMLAELSVVPCIIMDVDTRESAVIMLVENLQRRELDFIEEARGLSRLVNMYGYCQEEVARLVGLSQPAVANKIRLLKLPPDLLLIIREAGLSERHARALLRLNSEHDIINVLEEIIKKDMNVAKTELYIESYLNPIENPPPLPKPEIPEPIDKAKFVLKDVRLFLNAVTRGVRMMNQAGIKAGLIEAETDREIRLTVTIPKKK